MKPKIIFAPLMIIAVSIVHSGNLFLIVIKNEFKKQKSFSVIAKDYKLSTTEVIRLFDESFPEIQRGYLPEALCIDEIGFKTYDGSYAAIIYDHDKKVVTDVIRNRQTEYLRTYFYKYSFKERMRVKYFVSDLYEGYVAIKEEFFNTAIHVVDLFHVIRLLRVEVSRLRVRTYKDFTTEEDIERNFMKNHWQYFEMRMTHKIMYKTYYSKKHKREYTISLVKVTKGSVALGQCTPGHTSLFIPYGVAPLHYRQLFINEFNKLYFFAISGLSPNLNPSGIFNSILSTSYFITLIIASFNKLPQKN